MYLGLEASKAVWLCLTVFMCNLLVPIYLGNWKTKSILGSLQNMVILMTIIVDHIFEIM